MVMALSAGAPTIQPSARQLRALVSTAAENGLVADLMEGTTMTTNTSANGENMNAEAEPSAGAVFANERMGKRAGGKAGKAVAVKEGRTRGGAAVQLKTTKPATSQVTKCDTVLKKLRSVKGATVEQLIEATGWQAHSVRGFLSGTVRKKLGLLLVSETGKDGVRRYRISDGAAG